MSARPALRLVPLPERESPRERLDEQTGRLALLRAITALELAVEKMSDEDRQSEETKARVARCLIALTQLVPSAAPATSKTRKKAQKRSFGGAYSTLLDGVVTIETAAEDMSECGRETPQLQALVARCRVALETLTP